MEKVWEIKERKYDDIIKQLLYNRGVDFDDKKSFFEPNFDRDLHDPYLMKGMKKAVKRILLAKEKNEKIGIFSDYDADGIPAAALFHKICEALGLKNEVYIPNREAGYGLSRHGIDLLFKEKCSLIVTADLGIRSLEEAKYCKGKNIDLIITDHHLPPEELPDAFCVINAKQKGDKYPFKELCGCGVVFKLAQALSKECAELDEKFLKWNLDLVAISTISDVVPLIGENRVLAKYGVMVIKKTRNLGLRELLKLTGVEEENINAYTVGFQIGPRINAPGRMDHATKSYELLITPDQAEARDLANWLNEKNEERQSAMKEVEKKAIDQIEKNNLLENNIIIASGKWLKGVIGPTASHLTEKFSRPVILFSEDVNYFIGSARSVDGVNIIEVLDNIKNWVYKFGGHKGAAGLTIRKSNFSLFLKNIIEYCNQFIDPSFLVKKISVDAEVPFSDLSKALYQKIKNFEPHGMGNSKPVFLTKNVNLSNLRYVGSDCSHLSFAAESNNKMIKSIMFNIDKEEKLDSHTSYDIVYNLDLNCWRNREDLNLNVIDMKVSK